MPNNTRQDAFERVVQAKLGSLAEEPTSEYLEGLRDQLYVWLREVEVKIETSAIADAEARELAELVEGGDFELLRSEVYDPENKGDDDDDGEHDTSIIPSDRERFHSDG